MFTSQKKLETVLNRIIYGKGSTEQTVVNLKKEIAELKLTRTMEEREIKHLVKLKEEASDLEYQKKEVELKAQFADKEQVLLKEYHDKSMKQLETFRKEAKQTSEEILKRLPNISASLEIAAGGGSKKKK